MVSPLQDIDTGLDFARGKRQAQQIISRDIANNMYLTGKKNIRDVHIGVVVPLSMLPITLGYKVAAWADELGR